MGIDADGMTTARKLYEFLGLNPSNYSKWCKRNITENEFAEENVDFIRLVIKYESGVGVKEREDFKLTANFAKKLSMQGKTERAEQAREYFTGLERKQFSELSKTDTSINTTDLTVKDVDLFGDTVVIAQDKDGMIWVGVRWICEGLGLSEGQKQRQITNIKQDIVVNQGVANLQLPTNGGSQKILCLQLDYIPLWLAKISITPNMKENNPELVDKLVKYQLEAKDVLAAAFLPEGYKIKIKKQHSEQHQTNKVKHYTSSTPIPKIKDEMDYKEIESSKPYELPENYMEIKKN